MRSDFLHLKVLRNLPWLVPIVLILALAAGCASKEPPLSPGAAEFKKEVKDCLTTLQTALIAPVSRKDLPGINETLKTVEPQALKLCRMCPFQISVLDHEGYSLAIYPPKKETGKNYSHYELVKETLKTRRTRQKRLFLQSGSQIYLICAPLQDRDKLLGLLVLAVSVEEAQKRWDLSPEQFMALDFNH